MQKYAEKSGVTNMQKTIHDFNFVPIQRVVIQRLWTKHC